MDSLDSTSTNGVATTPRGGETILIVEDEEAVRRIVSLALKGRGYTVLAAPNCPEALELLRSHTDKIDLLLTDITLPDSSGRELASAARKLQPGLRVLYMSGYTDDALDRHGLREAVEQFIQKPFTSLALTERVREILDRSESL